LAGAAPPFCSGALFFDMIRMMYSGSRYIH
jgi:hypothetical protein